MEFLKSIGVLLFVTLYLCALVKADINEQKKIAIQNLDALMEYNNKLVKYTLKEVEHKEFTLTIITSGWKNLGIWTHDDNIERIKRIAQSANMTANLKGSPKEVFKCIEDRQKEALEDSNKYYYDGYDETIGMYALKAQSAQRQLINNWIDDYSTAIYQNSRLRQRSIMEIEKATTESAIDSVVKKFEKATTETSNIITSIHPKMLKIHFDALAVPEKYFVNFKEYVAKKVEDTSKATDQCFTKKFLFYPKSLLINKLKLY